MMWKNVLFLPSLFFLWLGPVKVESISITETPVTQTANYYSSVTFTCRGTGDILNWTVDTLPVDETTKGITINDTSDGHDLSSNLTIEVPPTNDDSIIIGCVIVTISPYDIRGPTAKLIIRGVSSVENVNWNPELSILSWSPPPFHSSDTNTEDFIYHIVLNGDSLINTTNNSIQLNISVCENFNVSITVFFGQYISLEKSKLMNDTGNYNVSIISHTVKYNKKKSSPEILLQNLVECSTQFCNHSIFGKAIHSAGKEKRYKNLEVTTKEKQENLSYTMTELELYSSYNVIIYMESSSNVIEDTDNVTLSTYFAQNVTIHNKWINGSVIIKCDFIEESIADGCHVIFNDTTQKLEYSFNITGSKEELVTVPESGDYNVTVYDIVNKSFVGPAFELWEAIKVIIQPNSSDYTEKSTEITSPDIIPTTAIIIPTEIISMQSTDFHFSTATTITASMTPTTEPPPGRSHSMIIVPVVVVLLFAIGAGIISILIIIVVRRNKSRQGEYKTANDDKDNSDKNTPYKISHSTAIL